MISINYGNNTHELIKRSIQYFISDLKGGYSFYGEFGLLVNYSKLDSISTCGVTFAGSGMVYYFNSDFLDSLNTYYGVLKYNTPSEMEEAIIERQKQVNFINIHEYCHLIFNHPQRTKSGGYDHKLSNIAQDMIINSTIVGEIPNRFLSIPKYPHTEENDIKGISGTNMALFIPKEYDGTLLFEELYFWLVKEKESRNQDPNKKKKNKTDKGGQGNDSPKGKSSNGTNDGQSDSNKDESQNGGNQPVKSGNNKDDFNCKDSRGNGVDGASLDDIFDRMDSNNGQFMDAHIPSDVPDGLKDAMINDALSRLRSRGLMPSSVEELIRKLRVQKKDYLKQIKRDISNHIVGSSKKQKTITRPNRRSIEGIKGKKKYNVEINAVWDTSGSMHGLHEKVLSYIYQRGITINLIPIDAEIHDVYKIKSKMDLEKVKMKGGGGTVLQPAIDFICNSHKLSMLNTVVLTDGACDSLDFSNYRKKVILISAGVPVPILNSNARVLKNIVIKDE